MYQPRPLIALICLLDLMMTMFFASLLMVDPTDATPAPAPPAPSTAAAPPAAADSGAIDKLKASLAERDKTIAAMQAKIKEPPSSSEKIRQLEQQLQSYEYEFADARSVSGTWRGTWDCEDNHLDVEFTLRGYPNGKVIQTSSRYRSPTSGATSAATTPSVEGYLRRDGSLEILRTYNTLDDAPAVWNKKYRMLGMAGNVSGDTFEGYLIGCEVHGNRWFKLARIAD